MASPIAIPGMVAGRGGAANGGGSSSPPSGIPIPGGGGHHGGGGGSGYKSGHGGGVNKALKGCTEEDGYSSQCSSPASSPSSSSDRYMSFVRITLSISNSAW